MRPCPSCTAALEQAAYALFELEAFHRDCLPELPEKFSSYKDLGEFLVVAAGRLRVAERQAP